MGWYLYLLAALMLIVAVWVARSRRGNSVRARDISGNVIVGDVSGTVSQVSAPRPTASKSEPDRVAWTIGIIGVLVAVAQLVHDVLK